MISLHKLMLLVVCLNLVFFIYDGTESSIIDTYVDIDGEVVTVNESLLENIRESESEGQGYVGTFLLNTPFIGTIYAFVGHAWSFVTAPIGMVTQANLPVEVKLLFAVPLAVMFLTAIVSALWRHNI